MNKNSATFRSVLGCLLSATVLAACGGGGGDSSPPPPPSPPPAPTVTVSASPSSLTTGTVSVITWSSTNATSCTASGAWSGTRATSGTENVGPITAAATYTLTCTGAGGSGNGAVTVNFTPPPTVTLSASPTTVTQGQTTTLTWSSTNATGCTASGAWSGTQATSGTFAASSLLVGPLNFTLSCTGSGGTAQASTTVMVGVPVPPMVNLVALPANAFIGDSVTLSWMSQGVSDCVASGGWSGPQATSGTAPSGPLAGNTTFTLTCTGPSGPLVSSLTVTATPMPPPAVSISVTPASVTVGTTAQLNWGATNAMSCTASGGWSGDRPTFGSLQLGVVNVTTTYTLTCNGRGGTTSASATLTVTGPNTAPIANAGADRSVTSGDSVAIFAVLSSDPGGSIESYAWTQVAGPSVALFGSTSNQVAFAAPVVSSPVTLTLQLVVTDNLGLQSAPDLVNVTVGPAAGGVVTLSGRITYDRIPFTTTVGGGLDFNAIRQEPSRGVSIELLNNGGYVLDRSTTDASGGYSFSVPGGVSVNLRVRAELRRAAPAALPRWNVTVRDVGLGAGAYAVVGPGVTATTATTFNLNIPSGWDPVSRQPNNQRVAAPFAILDTIYRSINTITAVAPTADFPVLTIDWAENNAAGETFYDSDGGADTRRISLSGQNNADIDEYDAHTIAHEFGHYIEDRFSRSDSVGGPHTFGDRLDPRVAFSEGFGYAFAAIVMDDPLIRDAGGANQASELFFNIETDSTTAEGWYSEGSVQEILWDLYDSTNDGSDTLALGLAPLWSVLTGSQRNTESLTTIFQFISALKAQNAASAAQIDTIVGAEGIVAPSINAFATTETNSAASADVLPVYTDINVGSGPVTVRSISTFGVGNKLSNRRYLRLVSNTVQRVRVRASIAAVPRDPDIIVWRRGEPVAFGITATNEDFFADLEAGTYVIETYDCGNADCGPDTPGPFDIAVTISAN